MSYMFVQNFEAIGHVTLVLELKNRVRNFGTKSGLSQKRLEYGKNISYGYMSSDTFSSQPTHVCPQ